MDTQNQRTMRTDIRLTPDAILAADAIASNWTEQETLDFFDACFDRDVLLKTLLGYASQWLSTRLIAVVTKNGIQPFMLEGWPDSHTNIHDTQHLRTIRAPFQPLLPTENPTPQNPANLLTLATLQTSGLQPLFDALELPAPSFLAVQAVQVATKTVLLLIGAPKQPSATEAPPELDIYTLNNAAIAVGKQLEEIINHTKSATLPPPDERIPPLPRPLTPNAPATVVVEELTNALLTHIEIPHTPVDDGWLDLLEDPKNATSNTPAKDPISTHPTLNRPQQNTDNPALTLEMFPDALLNLERPGQTITHGFEKLDEDSTPQPAPQTPETQPENLARKTLAGGFEAISREPQPENIAGRTLSGGFEAIDRNSNPNPTPTPEPIPTPTPTPKPNLPQHPNQAPNARILRHISLTPRSFQELSTSEPEVSTPNPSQESPNYDLQALKKAFPGPLLIDRYQHTAQTMPPPQEHGPLLAELVNIGPPALDVVREYIDANSLELRFYAVLLLTEFPAHNLLEDAVERLFDRDQQIRTLAQTIILNARLNTGFERIVLQRLRHEIITNYEEMRVEVAAELTGNLQDTHAIPLLIEALGQHRTRLQLLIQQALRQLTFQDHAPSPSEWNRWWQTAQNQPRTTWLIEALDAPNPSIRQQAFTEIQKIPGLSLNYHPDQPQKLRARAQSELTRWFENF